MRNTLIDEPPPLVLGFIESDHLLDIPVLEYLAILLRGES
jgi:hypothetical protein